jgi:hypothetical protein
MAVERATVSRVARKNSFLVSALRFAGYDPKGDSASTPRTDGTEATVAALSGGRYMAALPADVEPVRALLTGYSGIRPEDVDRHVYQMVSLTQHPLLSGFFAITGSRQRPFAKGHTRYAWQVTLLTTFHNM